MLSHRVIERLIVYRRLLRGWSVGGRDKIYSHELASLAGVTPAQVRRDIMAVEYAGSPAKGYDVAQLVDQISALLGASSSQPIALVGIGHLGQALMAYFNRNPSNLSITAAFDVDEAKVDRVLHGCHCHPLARLEEVLVERGVKVAALATPAEPAQEVVARLVEAGVTGVLNFTPQHLHVPPNVYVEDVDIAILLEKVAFFARSETDPHGELPWPQIPPVSSPSRP